MTLNEIRDAYITEGVPYIDATARTAQDVILMLLAKSPLAAHVTIKGGVVIQHLSGDKRRATQDFDFDFIRYPITDKSIVSFIDKLGEQSADISVKITGDIEELRHQDYHGKRVYIDITDNAGTSISTKLDVGVHKDLDFGQIEYCFDLGKLDDSVTLLINTKEQIFTEKLKSLLRIGAASTRYKDVFDMYYLAIQTGLDSVALDKCFTKIIYDDTTMREKDMQSIRKRLSNIFGDRRFFEPLSKSKRSNWLAVPAGTVIGELLDYFEELSKVY